tara:strand:+ start:9633 stop:10016 length:384 start_codon:yes stop_codon:yes gene_type:complete
MSTDFSKKQEQAIWDNAQTDKNNDSNTIRKDCCGAWIQRDAYGDRDHIYGWEIDHAYPASKTEINEIFNLRAMHWRNNQSKGNDYPDYTAVVTSSGNQNIDSRVAKTVNEATQKKVSAHRVKLATRR